MTRVDPTHALFEEFWRTDVHRCISCGNCLYVCPVFRQVKDEAFSARGRNESLRDGAQEIASGAPADPDSLSRCLLCGRCSAICPQGVQHDKVVLSRRADVFARGGGSSAQSLVKWLLTHRQPFRQVLRLVSRLQFLLPGSIVGHPSSETPIVRHLPTLFSVHHPPRRIPSIATRFLSDRVPEISASTNARKEDSAHRLLRRLRNRVHLPECRRPIDRIADCTGRRCLLPEGPPVLRHPHPRRRGCGYRPTRRTQEPGGPATREAPTTS